MTPPGTVRLFSIDDDDPEWLVERLVSETELVVLQLLYRTAFRVELIVHGYSMKTGLQDKWWPLTSRAARAARRQHG